MKSRKKKKAKTRPLYRQFTLVEVGLGKRRRKEWYIGPSLLEDFHVVTRGSGVESVQGVEINKIDTQPRQRNGHGAKNTRKRK